MKFYEVSTKFLEFQRNFDKILGAGWRFDRKLYYKNFLRFDQSYARPDREGCNRPQSAPLRLPPVAPKVWVEPLGPVANRTAERQLGERGVVVHRACK